MPTGRDLCSEETKLSSCEGKGGRFKEKWEALIKTEYEGTEKTVGFHWLKRIEWDLVKCQKTLGLNIS